MTLDLHSASYDVLNGAQALRSISSILSAHGADQPLRADDRDHMVFVISMMAEKAQACAEAWIEEHETQGSK